MSLNELVDLSTFSIADPKFRATCRKEFGKCGVLVMRGFVIPEAINSIRDEGEANRDRVYARVEQHTVYLSKPDSGFAEDHARNWLVTSSKGCITGNCSPLI